MMKSLVTASLMLAAYAPSSFGEEVKLETDQQKVSYLIGRDIGENMKAEDLDIDQDVFTAAFKEAMAGTESQISDADAQAVMAKFQQQMQEKMMAKQAAAAKAGVDFLAKNKAREGVMVTDSGLQYEILTPAEGAKPTAADKVKVHYHGTLIDGTVFDSSVERGEPIEFPLGGVIPGWTEGLQLMPIGSKFKFYIPSELAYGDRGQPPTIQPGSTLIFEVELLDIPK